MDRHHHAARGQRRDRGHHRLQSGTFRVDQLPAAPDTALVTLLAVLLVAVLFKGLLGRLNILVGVIIGYVYACIRGQVDFSAIGDAAWIGFPKFHLPQADFSILPMFILLCLCLWLRTLAMSSPWPK